MILIRTLLAGMFVFAWTSSGSADVYTQTQSGAVSFPSQDPIVLTFTGTPLATSDGTLSLIATGGELNNSNKRLEQLDIEGDEYHTPGAPDGWMLPINQLDGSGVFPDPVTIPLAALNGYTADGQVVVSVVRPGFLGSGSFDMVLEFNTIPEPSALGILALGSLALFFRRRELA